MPTLAGIKNRVRQILDDSAADRFSEDLVENAIRQALTHIDESLPRILTKDLTVTIAGRDQSLAGMEDCLYLINLEKAEPSRAAREVELKAKYSYTLQAGSLQLHFSGTYVPQAGETLRVKSAFRNLLSGLDGAETSSLSDSAAAAIELGAAGYACLLRAAAVAEAYAVRPGESARLVEHSRLWLEQSVRVLNNLKKLQEFGYPPGFALDRWDQKGS